MRYEFPTQHGQPGQDPGTPAGTGARSATGTDARLLRTERGPTGGTSARDRVPLAAVGRTAPSVRSELSLPTVTPLSTYLHAHTKLYKQQ